MDITKVCRCCMKEDLAENIDYKTIDHFYLCTNIIKTINEDKLPTKFCRECIENIEATYNFIMQAQKVDKMIKNIILDPQSSCQNEVQQMIPECEGNFCNDDTLSNHEFLNETIQIVDTSEIGKAEDIQHITHRIAETKDPNSTFPCSICGKSFSNQSWWNRHMKRCHEDCKFYCELCPMIFPERSAQAAHAARHAGGAGGAGDAGGAGGAGGAGDAGGAGGAGDAGGAGGRCGQCGVRLATAAGLRSHARSHSTERPFQCDVCSMRFKVKSVLAAHMRVHDRSRPHLCAECSAAFAQKSNLVVHARTHSGAKPHGCPQPACGYRAAAAANLARHAARHGHPHGHPHAGAGHTCGACGKTLGDASSLARHRRIHTGELPYRCPLCPRALRDAWKRKLHLMRHHQMALHEIPRMRRDATAADGAI